LEYESVEKGHGRLEWRGIRTSSELEGYSDFPGLRQVAEVRKRVVMLKGGEVRESKEYLFTSLSGEEAGPRELLQLARGHWRIENQSFHVRDDSFGEDRQVLCSHHGAAVCALLRAAAIGLLRGQSGCWKGNEPLTARSQWVDLRPLNVLGINP
jgi:hypothetical protein